jgi:hypothetical protein
VGGGKENRMNGWRERLWALMEENEDGEGEQETPSETPPKPTAETPKPPPLGLRKHADKLEGDLRKERQERQELEALVTGYRRQDAFRDALVKANVSDVTLEEIGDLPPEQITPDLVKAKSDSKVRASLAAKEEQAKSLGFESAEAMDEALTAIREQRERAGAAMAANAAVAKSGPGAPPPQQTPTEEAWAEFQGQRKQGRAQDKARGAAVTKLIERAIADSAGSAGRPT